MNCQGPCIPKWQDLDPGSPAPQSVPLTTPLLSSLGCQMVSSAGSNTKGGGDGAWWGKKRNSCLATMEWRLLLWLETRNSEGLPTSRAHPQRACFSNRDSVYFFGVFFASVLEGRSTGAGLLWSLLSQLSAQRRADTSLPWLCWNSYMLLNPV